MVAGYGPAAWIGWKLTPLKLSTVIAIPNIPNSGRLDLSYFLEFRNFSCFVVNIIILCRNSMHSPGYSVTPANAPLFSHVLVCIVFIIIIILFIVC